MWAVELEFGILRCAPTGTAQQTVSDEEYINTALLLSEDVAALRRTLCCFAAVWAYPVAINRLSPFGPEGGCIGYLGTITVQVIPRDTWPA